MAPYIPSDNEPGLGTRGTALASVLHPTGTPFPPPPRAGLQRLPSKKEVVQAV